MGPFGEVCLLLLGAWLRCGGESLPFELLAEERTGERVDVSKMKRSGESTKGREMIFSKENGIIQE